MNLLLLLPEDARDGARFTVGGARADHLRSVLEVKVGQRLHVGQLNGALGTAEVEKVGAHEVQLVATFEDAPPPRRGRRLILAVPRPKVLRRLLPQIASLGVEELVLLRSWRVRRSYLQADVLHPEVYRPLLLEGLMQGGLTHEPKVRFEPRFLDYVEHRLAPEQREAPLLIGHPRAARHLADVALEPGPVTLAIGPEAGFLDEEIASLEGAGGCPVRLAGPILKVETACIAGWAQVELALEFSRRAKGRTVPPECP